MLAILYTHILQSQNCINVHFMFTFDSNRKQDCMVFDKLSCYSILVYHIVPKVAAPATFGISRPKGLQLSGGCYSTGQRDCSTYMRVKCV